MLVRHCEQKDIPAICNIYNHYILNSSITFEEDALDASTMLARMKSYTTLFPWLVCEVEGTVVGYAYATKWKERAAYKKSLEITVYVEHLSGGKGYGKALYSSLLTLLSKSDCHVIIGGIALPNEASVGLHEHFGFKKVAHFSEIGFKFGKWIDVGYWQKTLNA
jgi:phosphinothricin acetyltransferase